MKEKLILRMDKPIRGSDYDFTAPDLKLRFSRL